MQIAHNGKTHVGLSQSELQSAGVPSNVIASAARDAGVQKLTKIMNGYRDRVASSCAGKLIAYQFKAKIAAAPDSATSEDLALIDREATARGIARQDLLDLINAKHSAYRETALLIEALEAEGKAAIAAVPDNAPDIEAAVNAALSQFTNTASAEFGAAIEGLDS